MLNPRKQRKYTKKKKNKKKKDNVFSQHYARGGWGSGNKSGPGSSMIQTIAIRTFLPVLLQKYNINTFLDISCGGMNWLPHVLKLRPNMNFIGLDVADTIIEENKKKFKTQKRWSFRCWDATKETITAEADMAMCRHTMMHLSLENAKKMLDNLWQTSNKILLRSHESVTRNPDTNRRHLIKGRGGGYHWAHMNMRLEPFNLPEPTFKFKETTSNSGEFLYLYVR